MGSAYKRLLNQMPTDYRGLLSTIAISVFAVFLTLWSNSTLYLLTPLWLVPLFILRNPRSDRLAREWFRHLEPLFQVKPIVSAIRGRAEAVGTIVFIFAFICLAIDFFGGENRPLDWLPLLFYALIGIILAMIIGDASIFALLVMLLALQLIIMLITTVGLRVLSTVFTLIRFFPYTVGRMYSNYSRIVFSDDLTSPMEIAPKYDAREYLKDVNDIVESMVKNQSEAIMDSKVKIFGVLLIAGYYLGAMAVAFIPSILPRLCVKATFLPLSFVFVLQPKHLKSKEHGLDLHTDILEDRVPLIFAILIMIALACLYGTRYLIASEFISIASPFDTQLIALIDFSNERYAWVGISLTCLCTIIIFLLVWMFQKSTFSKRHSKAFDYIVRGLSVIRLSCTTLTMFSILTSDQMMALLFSFLGVAYLGPSA